MALFVLGDNNTAPPKANGNKGPFADLNSLLASANATAEQNVNKAVVATEAAVISIPHDAPPMKPKHEKIYLDAFRIRNQLGKVLKKLAQPPSAQTLNADPDCAQKLERMEYLVLALYKYFVEVNNAFRLSPEQQANKMKRLIDQFYADKVLKENLKILVPEGEVLPVPNSGPPQQQNKPRNQRQQNKPRNQRQQNKPRNQRQQNKPRNQRQQNKPRNQQQNKPRNQRQNQQRNQQRNQRQNQGQNKRQNQQNKPRNQRQNQGQNKRQNKRQNQRQNQGNNQQNNRVNKKTGELGIVNSIQELIFG